MLERMQATQNQIYIAIGVGVFIVLICLGYVNWLSHQPPVLAKSVERDSLTGVPDSIKLNPMRDRSSEKAAVVFIRAMRDGHCEQQLAGWEKDYRRKYAAFICDSETKHPLIGWQLVDWEDQPPLRILHYRGKRLNTPGAPSTYSELFSITLEHDYGDWQVTKYDAMY